MTPNNVPFEDKFTVAMGFAMIMAGVAWLFGELGVIHLHYTSKPYTLGFAFDVYAFTLAGAYVGFSLAQAIWQLSWRVICWNAAIIVPAYAAVCLLQPLDKTPPALMTPFLIAMGVFQVSALRGYLDRQREQQNNPE
jgi:hypothetical protein